MASTQALVERLPYRKRCCAKERGYALFRPSSVACVHGDLFDTASHDYPQLCLTARAQSLVKFHRDTHHVLRQ